MSTDLRTALRDVVGDAPAHGLDTAAVILAGRRRVRRRAAVAVGSCALAAAAVVAVTTTMVQERPDPDPAPAEIVRLDLDHSRAVDLDVVASTRTAWDNDRDSLAYDRLAGLTADGLVLRTRYTNERRYAAIGLLDPATGATDWLPPPPGRPAEITPVELGEDRLVLAEWMHQGRTFHLFNRATRSWSRSVVHVTGGWEVHVPPLVRMGPDDRVYIGSTMEGESAPLHWWSAPLEEGGQARAETDLEGVAVAWTGEAVLRADPDGRVVVSTPAGETELSEKRPAACNQPAAFPGAAPHVLWAGNRPVVTYLCDSGSDIPGSATVVHDLDGGRAVEVADASAVAADDSHVLLAGATDDSVEHPGHSSTYVLDLDRLTIARIGEGTHDPQVALAAGMLLWNTPGPGDSQDAYDVRWRVARLD